MAPESDKQEPTPDMLGVSDCQDRENVSTSTKLRSRTYAAQTNTNQAMGLGYG